MRHHRYARLLAVVVGVVTGFSGPTLALAHGIAHARYSAEAHAVAAAGVKATEFGPADGQAIVSSSGTSGYFEPLHCQQCAERIGIAKLALPSTTTVAVVVARTVRAPAARARDLLHESAREFLPDQPRAPPQVS